MNILIDMNWQKSKQKHDEANGHLQKQIPMFQHQCSWTDIFPPAQGFMGLQYRCAYQNNECVFLKKKSRDEH